MRKHLKLIIILLIIAIAGGAVIIHKKLEKKGDATYKVNVTVQDKISGENYLDNFAFTTKKKNIGSFLENNIQIFSPFFTGKETSDNISSLFGIANTSSGSWKYSYSTGSSKGTLLPANNLSTIPLQNNSNLTFTFEK